MSFGTFDLLCRCVGQWLRLWGEPLRSCPPWRQEGDLHFLRGGDRVGDFLGGGGGVGNFHGGGRGVGAGRDATVPSKASSLPGALC